MKKNILFLFIIVLFFGSCRDNLHFKVIGNINNASSEVVYLEQIDLDKTHIIDSVDLKGNGYFYFKVLRPVNPDFYRIRIKNNFIVFSIDSTETITIESNSPSFSEYKIKGSMSVEKISLLRRSASILEHQLTDFYRNFELDSDSVIRENQEKLSVSIDTHKELAKKFILEDTRSPAAYYAVFQKINSLSVFDPANDDDLKYYAAVATAYNAFYPHSIRGKHLTNLVLQTKRSKYSQELKDLLLENSTGLIDINLPDIDGENIRLSSLKGDVVLIDFCYLRAEHSLEHVFSLRELFVKYHEKGFQIYTISFDDDYETFRKVVGSIPWVRVFDEDGLNSTLLRTYNINRLPTLFLMDKNNNIVSRHAYVDNDLKKSIEGLLAE